MFLTFFSLKRDVREGIGGPPEGKSMGIPKHFVLCLRSCGVYAGIIFSWLGHCITVVDVIFALFPVKFTSKAAST